MCLCLCVCACMRERERERLCLINSVVYKQELERVVSWKEAEDDFQSFNFNYADSIFRLSLLQIVASFWVFLHFVLLPSSSVAFNILDSSLSHFLSLSPSPCRFLPVSLFTLHYCQIPLLACVPLACGLVRSQPWQDL